MSGRTRRTILKGLAISAPAAWTTPLVKSMILPVHAQTSPCAPSLTCSISGATDEDSPDTAEFGSSGDTAWGWNNEGGTAAEYEAFVNGLQAQACPGTQVTISIVNSNGDGGVSVGSAFIGTGGANPLTVTADGSGTASFTERVYVEVEGQAGEGPNPLNFTLRFTGDDGSGPCDIPFCFTEYNPEDCANGNGPI